MTRLDSLCARVLKGKYYPHCEFLSATKRKRSSSTWRSVLHGRGVLNRGLIKRVGPGNIRVWEENWIPGLGSLKPVACMPRATAEWENDLFTPGTRSWDKRLVRKSFMALEAAEVLKIKPSWRLEDDILAWAFEKHGSYSVRSTYRILKQDHMAKAMATTNEQSDSGASYWGVVWKLNVPPKIRVFWWRVLHNSLPSKNELHRRHVAQESYCEMCGDPNESLYHVFFECLVARRFWGEVKKLMGMVVPNLHPCSWATCVENGYFSLQSRRLQLSVEPGAYGWEGMHANMEEKSGSREPQKDISRLC